MPEFTYTPAILEAFPDVVGGVLIGTAKNTPTSDALKTHYEAEQKAVIERIGDTPLSELETLSAWRSAFRQFNVEPTKYRSAAEALLRRLTKKGDIPSINTLVDLGNLVSIRYGLPVAVFDVRDLAGDILAVKFATGEERFLPLGTDESEHPDTCEVIFADTNDDVYARRWCWRQSQGSAAREDTTQIIVTVEAHHETGMQDITGAVNDLAELLTEYANFDGAQAILSKKQARFTVS